MLLWSRIARWKLSFVAGVVLAVGVVVPGAAGAPLLLHSFSDGVSVSKSDLTDLATQLRSGCTRKSTAVKSLSLATALANVQAALNRNSTSKARSEFAAGADAKTAASAASAVFGAVGAGKPWAAIDAALRVQKLDPSDASPLISLAGLVAAQDMPQEPLAFLNAAAKLKPKAGSPMGIDVQAVAANDRGLALLLLGHPKQAIGYLQTAERKAPLLSEARVNLDAAQQCNWVLLSGGSRGQPPVIADPPFWREDQSSDWTTDDHGDPIPVASSIFDLSQTADWTPVAIQFPQNPQQGQAMQDYTTALKSQIENQIITNSIKEGQLGAQVHDPNEQTAKRRGAVWSALSTAEWQPELRSLYQAFDSQYNALNEAINVGNGNFNGGSLDPSRPMQDALQQCSDAPDYDACMTRVCTSETQALHDKWLPQMLALNDASLRYETAYWKYAMGVAANVSDPADHQRLVLDAANSMLNNRDLVIGLSSLFQQSAEWAFTDYCDGGTAAPPQAGTVPDQNSSPACPKALNGTKMSFKVSDIFKFSIACEKVEFEVATKGWLGAFANVSYNPRTGDTTVFAGGKASAGSSGAKVGGFVTVSGTGSLVDGGMRVSGSYNAGAGGVELSRSVTVNFSVAGTVPFSQ